MKKLFFSLIFLSTIMSFSNAQSVQVKEDGVIGQMMFKMKQINEFNTEVEGWRIQILATTDRRKMEEVKTEFQMKYPLVSIDWIQDKPYYKLKAGAFSTKLEAARLLHRLKKDYPSAYPAKDNKINLQELIRS